MTEQEAAAYVVSGILQQSQDNWTAIHKNFKETFHDKFVILDENMAPFDLSLAAIAEDMQAVKNLFEKGQAERIEKWIFKLINTEDWGEYSVEEVNQYSKIFQDDIANIRHGSNPMTAIPARLLHKWLGSGIRNFEVEMAGKKTGVISPILLQMATIMLIGFTGKWKHVKENFKLVEADMPIDEKKPPKDFKEDEIKPDGTFQYYDKDGKLKEKWMPPDELEKLLKTHGAKQVYKVLIKGPWDGIKEAVWELDETTVRKFVDENDRAYAICAYKKGEPKYSFIAKKLWMRMEEVHLLLNDTKLSEQQKHQRIQEMLK